MYQVRCQESANNPNHLIELQFNKKKSISFIFQIMKIISQTLNHSKTYKTVFDNACIKIKLH